MATNIPPHNLKEVCNATIATIDNPEITAEELLTIIPGPDFPTGGEVLCGPSLHYAYAKGKGKVVMKAVAEIEDDQIIVKEIPYNVNKAELIIQIADLVKDKRIPGIRNINDESDREGIRIVIDVKKDVDPNVVLNQLYEFSRMRESFGINLLALTKNQPKLMSLKEIIQHHIEHRKEVITRRTKYDLMEAEKKVHLLEGLLVALKNIDEVIPGIRNSRTVEDAQKFLIYTYSLSELQAKAILEMRLQKLASLEQDKIKDEHANLNVQISQYKEILASEAKVLSLIKEELNEVKQNYGDDRKSKIVRGGDDDEYVDMEQLIEEEDVIVTMTNSGYVKRLPLDTYRTQKRGGKGMKATEMKDEDFVEKVYVASTHDYLLIFTDRGQLYWLKVYNIPEGSRQAKGKHINNILEMETGEKITAIVPVRNFTQGYLFMATKEGTVKKTELKEFSNPRKGGIRAINLDENDTLVGVKYTTGNNEIILATKEGQANRFNEEDVRSMGRTATGVRGIRLEDSDEVIGMLAADEGKEILTLTEKGYGKRTPVSEYRLCNRGGKGVTNIKITDKNGAVRVVMLVDGSEGLMIMSKNGIALKMKCSDISVVGRATQGVRVIRLEDGDELVASAQIIGEDEEVSVEIKPAEGNVSAEQLVEEADISEKDSEEKSDDTENSEEN
jgi:DNA gyrase subunit A